MKHALLCTILATALFAGCGEGRDYYSEVISKCNYTYPGKLVIGDDAKKTSLTNECRTALEAILPYDESFKFAKPEFKDKVTEGFQALLAWPVVLPPKHTIFGVAPGSFPLWFLREFDDWSNINQSIFNNLLELVHVIKYEPHSIDEDHSAQYVIDAMNRGVLRIADAFWNESSVLDYYFSTPIFRAGTLVHEGWHGKGFYHTAPCPAGGAFNCDADLTGPYGMTVVYYEGLLHGGGNRGPHGEAPKLSGWDVMLLGTRICISLKGANSGKGEVKGKFQYIHPELEALLYNVRCGYDVNAKWVTEREGLDFPLQDEEEVNKDGMTTYTVTSPAASFDAQKMESALQLH